MMEQIKIGLLAVIAIALGIQIYMQSTDSGSSSTTSENRTSAFKTTNPTTTPPINTTTIDPTTLTGDQGDASEDQTTVSFSETNFDMGTVKAGEKVRHTFEVTNTGSIDLKLAQLNADPGLTVIGYTSQPIPPGETGQIEVELDTEGMAGSQTKRVHVNSNSNPGHVHLNITVDIQ